MPIIRIVLVKPQNEGNLGAIARTMKNFGLSELHLIAPECEIGLEARRRAMHADDILENAKIFESIEDSLRGTDMVVGTSGVQTKNEKKFSRITKTPEEFAEKVRAYEGAVAILFGQEDFGLDRETIARCDMLITIPTSEEYPIMNVSHAAAIVLYELFLQEAIIWKSRESGDMEINLLIERFQQLLDIIEYPEHKRDKTTVMFRRIIGRAVLSKWEFHTMMGIIKEATKKSRKEKRDLKDQ